jgi:hypothetical protein
MKFDEWYDNTWNLGKGVKEITETAWEAAMEEFKRNPPEGLYRIREEVLANGKPGVVLVALNDNTHNCNPGSIRRKPAWVLKDGELVLFEYNGKAYPGVVEDGWVLSIDMRYSMTWANTASLVKPYKKGCVGKPWDEV